MVVDLSVGGARGLDHDLQSRRMSIVKGSCHKWAATLTRLLFTSLNVLLVTRKCAMGQLSHSKTTQCSGDLGGCDADHSAADGLS